VEVASESVKTSLGCRGMMLHLKMGLRRAASAARWAVVLAVISWVRVLVLFVMVPRCLYC
jgi:hypothetical protein